MAARVVDFLVQAVASLGVRHVFGVDGANIEDFYDAVHASDGAVTGVVAKHEFAAATMADGYARATGRLAVVVATSGGGAMNLVAGLAESFASGVPVLALVGQPPTSQEGKGAFQDSSGRGGAFDAAALYLPISHYCARVTSAEALPHHLHWAVAAARHNGPAVLLLPKDVQQAPLTGVPPFRPTQHRRGHDQREIDRVRTELAAAAATGKIVVIAGDQVARDDARAELHELVSVLDASVGVAPDAKDVYDHDLPGFCGVAGTMGHGTLIDAVAGSALCLLVGTRLPVTASAGLEQLLADAAVVSVGAQPPYVKALHATSTDLAATLAELAAALRPDKAGSRDEPGGPPGSNRSTTPGLSPSPVGTPGTGLPYRAIVEALNEVLEPGTDVFADAGNTGAAVVHHLRVPRGGRFVVALGMGGMGYAFGAGIGSAFARQHRPDGGVRRTVVVAGDGAFYMHGMEVHTALHYQLPVTFVVCNNNAHAMCVTREQLYYGDRYSFNRFRPAHPGAGMAAMFPQLPAVTAGTVEELTAALRQSFDRSGPSFVCVDCDPDEIPPFAPFLSASRRHP